MSNKMIEAGSPLDRYIQAEDVTLKRYQIERAVLHLDFLEGLALIRAAYNCTLEESKEIRISIMMSVSH